MLITAQIKYYSRDQIDTDKWNNTIQKADNGLIYAYSWYLDRMAPTWSALVYGDYELVMPFAWNRKYGIAYIYQPFLTAQLGIFGNDLTKDVVIQFLNVIPSWFRYWEMYLNHKNLFDIPGHHIYPRANYVLDLSPSYEELYRGYRENIRRNIKKATQFGCSTVTDVPIEKVIELATQQMRNRSEEIQQNVERFTELFSDLYKKKEAITYGIESAKGQLLSSCVFFFSHGRAYYILVGNHPDGRTLGASHALIDAFIKDYAGKKLLLDFEGSDIRNLAFFYSSFGAQEERFAGTRMNRLPFYLKWLKR
jgi:hypothetical protein